LNPEGIFLLGKWLKEVGNALTVEEK